MVFRFALLTASLLASILASPALGEEQAPAAPTPATTPTPAPAPGMVRVAMVTAMGTIELDLDAVHAPVTTANFLRYADERRFDGTAFYRVMRLDWGRPPNGLIQGGTQNDPKRILPPIAHEPTSQTGIVHKAGTISMARYAPGTATGDFSILLSDLSGLDADPLAGDPEQVAGFAAFGHVASGMDVVRQIYDAPLSATKGEGFLNGQMLEEPVRILSVRRVAPPAGEH
jgi:peptidyl-prolyl cis-trans isomerase A (cyclophilin A)